MLSACPPLLLLSVQNIPGTLIDFRSVISHLDGWGHFWHAGVEGAKLKSVGLIEPEATGIHLGSRGKGWRTQLCRDKG